ncbi:MAG TPA: hypothetical protein VKQ52_00635 [Puia sp.]|nr:hypothetical protein [Puia sp.]
MQDTFFFSQILTDVSLLKKWLKKGPAKGGPEGRRPKGRYKTQAPRKAENESQMKGGKIEKRPRLRGAPEVGINHNI